MLERVGSRREGGTGVETIDVFPAVLVVAAAKDPSDGVNDGDAVCAHPTVWDCTVDGGTTPVHDSRGGGGDVGVVGKSGSVSYFRLRGCGWNGRVG